MSPRALLCPECPEEFLAHRRCSAHSCRMNKSMGVHGKGREGNYYELYKYGRGFVSFLQYHSPGKTLLPVPYK